MIRLNIIKICLHWYITITAFALILIEQHLKLDFFLDISINCILI